MLMLNTDLERNSSVNSGPITAVILLRTVASCLICSDKATTFCLLSHEKILSEHAYPYYNKIYNHNTPSLPPSACLPCLVRSKNRDRFIDLEYKVVNMAL